MKYRVLFTLIVFMFTIVSSFAKERGDDLSLDLTHYSYPVIFKNLPDHVDQFKPYFQAIAFIILVTALIFAFRNSGNAHSYMTAIAISGLLAMCIANSSMFLRLSQDTVGAFNKALDIDSTTKIAHNMYNMALCFQGLKKSTIEEEDLSYYFKAETQEKPGYKDLIKFAKNPGGMISGGIKTLVTLTIAFLIHIILTICSIFVIIVDAIRFFLVQCASLLLPVFIAGLMTQTFRSQSIAYIFGLLGILFWPVGWSLGHIGTLALFDSIIAIINGTIMTESNPAKQFVENLQEIDNPYAHIRYTAEWLFVTGIGSLFSLAAMILGLILWVVIVTFSAPFLIQKVISSGAQYFSSIATGTAQSMSRTVGGTASYAMVRSAKATTLKNMASLGEGGKSARGQPSPSMRAGFSMARTLMNASRYDGNPSQLPHVFDSGLDELRGYRAEAAQVDISKMASDRAIDKVRKINKK